MGAIAYTFLKQTDLLTPNGVRDTGGAQLLRPLRMRTQQVASLPP